MWPIINIDKHHVKASVSRGLQPRRPGCSLNRSKRGAWEAAEHRDAVLFPSPGRLPRRLAFEKTAKQQLNVTKSHQRGKARERAWRAGRKYNIWRLPAAAQWSGIKKTRYLNSEQFLSFPSLLYAGQRGKVQQPVNLLNVSSRNKVALSALSAPLPRSPFPYRGDTERSIKKHHLLFLQETLFPHSGPYCWYFHSCRFDLCRFEMNF